ncbi:MAG: dihydroorotate dehydrogenase electron transfer subunit [Acidobacteria bacterium]|nr:dihydroorotate dehydrogenase electron transfer subunit [Acidobacteriota bacterium]MBI3426487.1 dihydroorotate dehydrogenase electron transfer subunit [Acidobacteriota bacterium]
MPNLMKDTIATVERNELSQALSGRRYGRLWLSLPDSFPILPGQFAMLKAAGIYEPLLRRAMAFYRSQRTSKELRFEFIYQILGRGTQALAAVQPGAGVEFLGPLGNTYDLDAARGREAVLVAGGVGAPALYMLAEKLIAWQIPTRLFIGGASQGDLCGLADFEALIAKGNVHGATMDGSYGVTGFVTVPLESYLQETPKLPKIIFACGPDPMLQRVAQIAASYDVPAQLSLEAPMGCGFGVCVGCAVAVKHECAEGFVYKKVCTDGPVFWGDELHF